MPNKIVMKMRDGQEGSITVDAGHGKVVIAFRRPGAPSVSIALAKAHAALLIEALQRELLDALDQPTPDAVVAIAAFLKDRDKALGMTADHTDAERLVSARQIVTLA